MAYAQIGLTRRHGRGDTALQWLEPCLSEFAAKRSHHAATFANCVEFGHKIDENENRS